MNTNTIAAQLNTDIYGYGGEVNTPPTPTVDGQLKCLQTILTLYPNCTINYRSNLHTHIRIPGLKDDLTLLKKIQKYIHLELKPLIHKLEPIPKGTTLGERKREKRRKISHQNFLSPKRLAAQLAATTPTEYFEAEVPKAPDGRVLWHLQSRLCVNLRQMIQTDTIEFRHFPGTLDGEELKTAFDWCRDFLVCAIEWRPLLPLLKQYSKRKFPQFREFNLDQEIGYQATCVHGKFTSKETITNIQSILRGTFKGTEAWQKAKDLAEGKKIIESKEEDDGEEIIIEYTPPTPTRIVF